MMSFTKNKYDSCFMQQTDTSNKSIFDYVVNSSPHISAQECADYTPPFLAYIPTGVKAMNIDLENDLKGITRPNSKCNDCKYNPSKFASKNPVIKHECDASMKILPNAYLRRV